MHPKSKLFLLVFLAGLIIMATFCGPAGASEFLADVVMKGGMMSGDGKMWVKGQMDAHAGYENVYENQNTVQRQRISAGELHGKPAGSYGG